MHVRPCATTYLQPDNNYVWKWCLAQQIKCPSILMLYLWALGHTSMLIVWGNLWPLPDWVEAPRPSSRPKVTVHTHIPYTCRPTVASS